MKTAKKITAAVLALCTLALILASCGAKPPEEEATTGTEIHSMLDPLGIGETKETGKDKEKNSTAKNNEKKRANHIHGGSLHCHHIICPGK